MMITLQLPDGNPVLVNVANTLYAQPCDEKTLLTLVGGQFLTVEDSFDAVAELFDPERQAAEPC